MDPGIVRSATRAATVTAVAMVAQQVGGKALRDALFLTHFPVSDLPHVVIAAAFLSVISIAISSRVLSRLGPALVIPIAFATSGGLFIAEFVAMQAMPRITAVVVYLHTAVFGAILISAFWSLVNERFDPHTARRVVGRIATGAAFGGLLGGVATERVASVVSAPAVLLLLASLSGLATAGAMRIGKPLGWHGASDRSVTSLSVLGRKPYLRSIAWLVTLVAIGSSLIDFAFKAEAKRFIDGGEELARLFAAFYTVVAVATFLTQSTTSKPALRRLGIAGTILLLPSAVLVFSTLGALIPRFWTFGLLRGVSSIISNSLFRSGYELLYTPVPPNEKRPTKAVIDVGFDKAGDATGGALILLVLAVLPSADYRLFIVLAGIAAAIAWWITRRLDRGYVAELEDSLRTGALQLDEADVFDATTRRTLTETAVAIDRRDLLARIEELRRNGDLAPGDSKQRASAEAGGPSLDAVSKKLVEAVVDLESGEELRIARVLARAPLDRRLVGHVLPLLAKDSIAKLASTALVGIARHVPGQLVDTLLDPTVPFSVRRRLPAVLQTCEDQRAAEGLFLALRDPRSEVRYRAALALSVLVEHTPEVRFDASRVFAAAQRALDDDERIWEDYLNLEEDPLEPSSVLDDAVRGRMHRSLQHVFVILGLCLERDVLRLSLRALFSGDPALRGTALEYLEHVLPRSVRKQLWPRIGAGRSATTVPPARRTRDEIREDLLRSQEGLTVPQALVAKRHERE